MGLSVPIAITRLGANEATKQRVDVGRSPSLSADRKLRTDKAALPAASTSVSAKNPQSFFTERPCPAIEIAPRVVPYRSRRDFLIFGAGALAAVTSAGFLLPQETLSRIGMRQNMDSPAKEWSLNRALRIDDDVAEALYSVNREVPTRCNGLSCETSRRQRNRLDGANC